MYNPKPHPRIALVADIFKGLWWVAKKIYKSVKKLITVLICAVALFTACTKEQTPEPKPEPENTDTVKIYKIQAYIDAKPDNWDGYYFFLDSNFNANDTNKILNVNHYTDDTEAKLPKGINIRYTMKEPDTVTYYLKSGDYFNYDFNLYHVYKNTTGLTNIIQKVWINDSLVCDEFYNTMYMDSITTVAGKAFSMDGFTKREFRRGVFQTESKTGFSYRILK